MNKRLGMLTWIALYAVALLPGNVAPAQSVPPISLTGT
jgi:hypothetical protein